MSKTRNNFQKIVGGTYAYEVKFKYFDNDNDTARQTGAVEFYYSDSKCLNYIENYTYYFSDHVNKTKKIVKDSTRYFISDKEKRYTTDTIRDNSDDYSDARTFLNSKGILFKLDSLDTVQYKGITNINNNACHLIRVVSPIEKDSILGIESQLIKTFAINKQTYYPEQIIMKVKMYQSEQYSEVTLKDFKVYDTKEPIASAIKDSLNVLLNTYSEAVSPTNTTTTDITPLKTAPDFTLEQLEGGKVQLSKLKAKLIVLDFWYVACIPCVASMPFLNELYDKYDSSEVAFYSINAFDKDKEKIAKMKDTRSIKYPILLGAEAKIHENYKVRSFPSLLILDENLNVLSTHAGYGKMTKREVFAKIDSLLTH